MNQRIILGTACVVLAALCIALGLALYKQPRFVTTKGENPYIMFDNKTAQACWSGPEVNIIDEALANPGKANPNPYAEFQTPRRNRAELPFCKDLK